MTKSLLTEKNFWKKGTEQSRKNKLPIKLNKKVRADRSFIEIFDNYFKSLKQDKECIEIGCNPGKFLIYFSENLGYKISGVDYDEDGIKLTNENITSLGIEAEIYQADIFEFQIKKKFDAVISMGFIEHFTNDKLDRVLESHLNLLKEDGLLFISIPNFRYINYLFSYFFRYDMISKHNLNMMNEDFFVLLSQKYNLEIKFFGYFGGLHPGGLKLGKENSLTKKLFSKIINKYENIPILDKINSKYFSHHLGAVFKRPPQN